MTWTPRYKILMKDMGIEPYACLNKGCSHVSRTWLGFLWHWRFRHWKG